MGYEQISQQLRLSRFLYVYTFRRERNHNFQLYLTINNRETASDVDDTM